MEGWVWTGRDRWEWGGGAEEVNWDKVACRDFSKLLGVLLFFFFFTPSTSGILIDKHKWLLDSD